MTQAQRQTNATRTRRPRKRRLEFIASVRFCGGTTQLFSVRNASDVEEARAMVLDEVEDVAAVLIAERRWR